MADSFEIDFVLGGDDAVDGLNRVVNCISETDGFTGGWRGENESVSLTRETEEVLFNVSLEPHPPNSDWYTLPAAPTIVMDVGADNFTIFEDVAEPLSILVDIIERVYHVVESCRYVCGFDTNHVGSVGEDWGLDKPVTDESLADDRIAEVSWLMLFGPEMVEEYGREWLRQAPAWKRTELDDGGIMLVASPDPTDYGTVVDGREKLRAYFGFTDGEAGQ